MSIEMKPMWKTKTGLCCYSLVFIVGLSSSASADQQRSVPPIEMAGVCASLGSQGLPIVEKAKSKGTSLQDSLLIAQKSVQHPTPPADYDMASHYEASTEVLIKQVYASSDTSPDHMRDIVGQACRAYAPAQYTDQDIRNLYECAKKNPPYNEIANARDNHLSADLLLSKIKQEIYSQASLTSDQKAKNYSDYSDAVEFAYAHPEMNGRDMARDRFNLCFQDMKDGLSKP